MSEVTDFLKTMGMKVVIEDGVEKVVKDVAATVPTDPVVQANVVSGWQRHALDLKDQLHTALTKIDALQSELENLKGTK